MTEQPIGVFDSGFGGLTVVRQMLDRLPQEKILYFADTAHVPYGPRPTIELIRFATEIASFLVSRGSKLIVAACNTSSSIALDILKDQFEIPIVGVVKPGASAALQKTKTGKIGVLATEATINTGAHAKQILALNPSAQVFGQACPRFVPLVEAGQSEDQEAARAAEEYVTPLLEKGVDTLLLGCTHYPFLTRVITQVAGPNISLVDPAALTVDHVMMELEKKNRKKNLLPGKNNEGDVVYPTFFVSGEVSAFIKIGEPLLGCTMEEVHHICIDGILEGVKPQLETA